VKRTAIAISVLMLVPAGLLAQMPLYTRTEEKIAMRDGVKLHTIIFRSSNQAGPLPFIFVRSPYGVAGQNPTRSSYLNTLAQEGYIFVFQDIRGRHQSEGDFVMDRAPRVKSDPKAIDESTDTNDTIDWLIKNVPNSVPKVGMLGISYDGWLTSMALIDPHPALAAGSPQSPPADIFLGDDFYHNGAFRLSYGFEYVAMMETTRGQSDFDFGTGDTYLWYLKLGPLSNVNAKYLHAKMPTWNNFVKHPNYDEFWQKHAANRYMKEAKVPTLNVTGWWDQEDFYGPLTTYAAFEKNDPANKNFLVVGPWNHGGWVGEGENLGIIKFGAKTGKYFREEVQAPFFAKYLKGKSHEVPEALTFQTGSNKWMKTDRWPPKEAHARKLYFHAGGKLSFDAPAAASNGEKAYDNYISDPHKPVPYRPRPIQPTYGARSQWYSWLVGDQRFVHNRPDVLAWETDVLEEDVVLAGHAVAKLFASTSGSDSDWVVKLIDVYPDKSSADTMAGYQLMVANDVFRGRFRKSFEKPEALEPNRVYDFTINMHSLNHCFKKGHRIMVQVQSTWFPLIDRNPQRFVPNIFEAKAEDFQSAEQRVYRRENEASHIEVSVLLSGASPRGAAPAK
jgi:uncharacterized protein